MKPLEREFQYYLDHQDEFVKKYEGKYIVVKDNNVIGVYNSDLEALEVTSQTEKIGTFLIQKCEKGSDSYTQMYYSRATFA